MSTAAALAEAALEAPPEVAERSRAGARPHPPISPRARAVAAPGRASRGPQEELGRLVMSALHVIVPDSLDMHNPRVARLVRRLRRRMTLAVCCLLVTAPITVVLLIQGVVTYASSAQHPSERPLRIWLIGFVLLQLAWPVCMPSLTLLLLGWCLGGLGVLLGEAGEASSGQAVGVAGEGPELRHFVVEAFALQLVQASLLLAAGVAAITARPLIQKLLDLLSHTGTDPEVLHHIPVVGVASDEECIICLSHDIEGGGEWRQLACGHRFHGACLLEWLGKARRCPLCRLDLHHAYWHPADSEAIAAAAVDQQAAAAEP